LKGGVADLLVAEEKTCIYAPILILYFGWFHQVVLPKKILKRRAPPAKTEGGTLRIGNMEKRIKMFSAMEVSVK